MSSPPTSSQVEAFAPPAAGPAATTPAPHCANCQALLAGPYCAQCGQKHHEDLDPSLREIAHEAGEELLHVDGKLGETLRLLFTRPGALTVEHWRGRRVRYVPGLRLYLTCSLVYFLVAAVADPVEKAVERGREDNFRVTTTPKAVTAAAKVSKDSVAGALEAEGKARGGTARIVFAQAARVQRDRLGFAREMRETIPKIFFAFVPVFAWIVGLVYRRRAHYPAHLYFALHTFAFGFLTAAAAEVVGLLPHASFVAGWALMLIWAWYGVRALQEVYGGTLRGTLARATAIASLGFLAFIALGMVGVSIVFFTF